MKSLKISAVTKIFETSLPQRLYSERSLLRSSYDTAVHTARNSNVDSVMSVNIIHLLSFLFYLPKSL